MGKQVPATAQRVVAISPDDGSAIDLRNPGVAALLSWLVPGLGQLYQRRRLKGRMFMVALVGILLLGLWIGGGRVVYCQWRPGARRLEFIGQAGIGAVAIPAVIQAWTLSGAGRPLLPGGLFAPPLVRNQPVSSAFATRLERDQPGMSFSRVSPGGWCSSGNDQLSLWYLQLGRFFDIGTLYTTIAGLLNLLVVYDAWAGPLREAEAANGKPEQAAGRRGAGRDGKASA